MFVKLLTLALLILLVVCSCSNRVIVPTPPSSTPAITGEYPSYLPGLQVTPTSALLSPKTTVSPSSLLPIETPIPIIQPTLTRVSALPAPEAEARAISLLQDNGRCRLPCFWGLVLGQANELTILSFLDTFQNIGGRRIHFSRDDSIIQISITWNDNDDPLTNIRWIEVFMIAYKELDIGDGTKDENVFDNPFYAQYTQYYNLSNLLSDYGPPSRVYVGVDIASSMGGDDIYHLYLDYSKSGWGVQLRMPVIRDDNYYLGCPAQAFTSLFLWSPEDDNTAREINSGISNYGIFIPLEEATAITLEEFYQRYKDPATTQCLETPVETWR